MNELPSSYETNENSETAEQRSKSLTAARNVFGGEEFANNSPTKRFNLTISTARCRIPNVLPCPMNVIMYRYIYIEHHARHPPLYSNIAHHATVWALCSEMPRHNCGRNTEKCAKSRPRSQTLVPEVPDLKM